MTATPEPITEHDPMCEFGRSWDTCHCELIARVRADQQRRLYERSVMIASDLSLSAHNALMKIMRYLRPAAMAPAVIPERRQDAW